MKKKYLAWMINGGEINIRSHDFIIQKLSQNFDKIYLRMKILLGVFYSPSTLNKDDQSHRSPKLFKSTTNI